MDTVFYFADFKQEYIECIIDLEEDWDSENNNVKTFKSQLYDKLSNNLFCPYCMRRLKRNKEDQLDHIVYKADYGNFTFQPMNIVIACKRCNNKKLSQNVLIEEYREWVKTLEWYNYPCRPEYYNIVHPYFDTYSEHIKIENDIFYTARNNSPKGLCTINMMKLDGFDFIEERAKECNAAQAYIRNYISNPDYDDELIAWARFLLVPASLQKRIFDILTEFQKGKNIGIKLSYSNYISLKNIILSGSGKYLQDFEIKFRASMNFIKIINNIDDIDIIRNVIEILENLYKLKRLNADFEYALFLAVILLIKLKEGCYNKENIKKYLE